VTEFRIVSPEGAVEHTLVQGAGLILENDTYGVQFTIEARPDGDATIMIKQPGDRMRKYHVGAFSLAVDLLAEVPWDDEQKLWVE